ncbi:uncharacterized protein LOC119320831 [Triticum dicoccoides]|uniref:uncharacterized protein LOC119320831 n=1 Tax=Triticum dicoccoides TaxID=85692 RepID=UPI001890DC1D|nr:uncharacterized protein LOC119320831 [Triticum dicoccoides]
MRRAGEGSVGGHNVVGGLGICQHPGEILLLSQFVSSTRLPATGAFISTRVENAQHGCSEWQTQFPRPLRRAPMACVVLPSTGRCPAGLCATRWRNLYRGDQPAPRFEQLVKLVNLYNFYFWVKLVPTGSLVVLADFTSIQGL